MNKPIPESLGAISTTLLALESLRVNETGRALELLEIQLDASILTMNRLASGTEAAEREAVQALLQRARDYRRAYPRRTEAELNDLASGLLVRSAHLGKERAAKILDDLG